MNKFFIFLCLTLGMIGAADKKRKINSSNGNRKKITKMEADYIPVIRKLIYDGILKMNEADTELMEECKTNVVPHPTRTARRINLFEDVDSAVDREIRNKK